MTTKTGENQGGNWLIELVCPGVFTIILLGCMAHLWVCIAQAQPHSASTEYAISAFAN